MDSKFGMRAGSHRVGAHGSSFTPPADSPRQLRHPDNFSVQPPAYARQHAGTCTTAVAVPRGNSSPGRRPSRFRQPVLVRTKTCSLPFHHPAELAAEKPQDLDELLIGRTSLFGEELEHADYFAPHEHRECKDEIEPAPTGLDSPGNAPAEATSVTHAGFPLSRTRPASPVEMSDLKPHVGADLFDDQARRVLEIARLMAAMAARCMRSR